ncbi:MAG: ATP-dependent DNA helicase RecG [Candidatus Tagabacteria bacterium]
MNFNSLLTDELRLSEYQKRALNNLGFKTAKDLLWHFPFRYEEFASLSAVADLTEGIKATVCGKILETKMEKTWRKKMTIAEAVLSDGSGQINLVWFRQPYIAKMLKIGDAISATGKIQKNKKGLPAGRQGFYIANPIYEKIGAEEIRENRLVPIYPESAGLSSRWFRFAINKILKKVLAGGNLKDPLPDFIVNRYHLPSLKTSLIYIHSPKNLKDAEAARKRFAFEEVFAIQLSRIKQRIQRDKQSCFSIKSEQKNIDEFISSFSFDLTSAQKKAINNILNDFQKKSPMARLLEGDVGSGKTVVAATTAFGVVKSGYQVAYMAPTEVLSRQHFKNFTDYFGPYAIKIGLITSSECLKFPSKAYPGKPTHISKSQLLKWTVSGEIPILIGTHSLIQEKVKFKNLAYVIIDEQHKFGTSQRQKLAKKSIAPHLLSMTATPIPRTLALTIYGDLDLTLLDEMPPGRKNIITKIVSPRDRQSAYDFIREEIKKEHQAYVICPRINEQSDSKSLISLTMKSVKAEYEKLSKKIFPEYKVAMLHGQMKTQEKEKIMSEFREGKIKILVATSVIEVGIDVPNATVILIEGAERFGLAQLHQLRGRVMRSCHQPYCFIFTETNSLKSRSRLKALLKAKNGFELAEYDLKFRGAGELAGRKQWGISDVGMEALKNLKMVEAARTEAQNLLKQDSELKSYPLLAEKLTQQNTDIHFE